jgi:hypothetical protein
VVAIVHSNQAITWQEAAGSAVDIARHALIEPLITTMSGWSVLDLGGDDGALLSFVCSCRGATEVTVSNQHRGHSTAFVFPSNASSYWRSSWPHAEWRVVDHTHPSQLADLVLAFDCLHVVTQCADVPYHSFTHALRQLATRARRMLVIEWIDPTDPAVIAFAAPHDVSAYYTLDNFLAVMGEVFGAESCIHVGSPSPTRQIYIGIKNGKRI